MYTPSTYIDTIELTIDNHAAFDDVNSFIETQELNDYKEYIKSTGFSITKVRASGLRNTMFSFHRVSYYCKFNDTEYKLTKIRFYGLKSYNTKVDDLRHDLMLKLIKYLNLKTHCIRITTLDIALDIPLKYNQVLPIRTQTRGIQRNKISDTVFEEETFYLEQLPEKKFNRFMRAYSYDKRHKEHSKGNFDIEEELTRFEVSIMTKAFALKAGNEKELIQERLNYYKVYAFETVQQCTAAIDEFEKLDMKWSARPKKKMEPLLNGFEVHFDMDVVNDFIDLIYSFERDRQDALAFNEMKMKYEKKRLKQLKSMNLESKEFLNELGLNELI